MAINIVTSVQPLNVENIITFIYGDPGIWKTSLAFTAKNPILFDFTKALIARQIVKTRYKSEVGRKWQRSQRKT